ARSFRKRRCASNMRSPGRDARWRRRSTPSSNGRTSGSHCSHLAQDPQGRGGAPDAPGICDVIGGTCLLRSHHLSEVSMPIVASLLDRDQLIAWYRRNRQRSSAIFGLIADEAYYSRPIAQRHPLVFYEGHLPAFSFNTLVKRALGARDIDEGLQRLFARGI